MHFRSIHWSTAAALMFGLVGCADDPSSRPNGSAAQTASQTSDQNTQHTDTLGKETPNVAKRKLVLSKNNESGNPVRVGTLYFDESNRAALETEGTGPAVEQLKRDWEEISKQNKLIWKKSVPDEIDGRTVTRIVGEEVAPGDENYIYAILNTLERKYGYTVDLAD